MIDVWNEATGLKELRDSLISSGTLFVFKKLVYLSKESAKVKNRFWRSVFELYPELDGNTLEFNPLEGVVTVSKEMK